MASPLSVFRRYQYALLVVFGVMLMVAFVIAPPIMDYQRVRSQNATNTLVVSWKGGSLHENDIQGLVLSRNLVRMFLDNLSQRTLVKNGLPRVPRVLRVVTEETVVQTQMLAEQATRLGLRVSDEAVLDYLEQLSAELIPRGEIGDVFRESLGGRMAEAQLFDILRTELLAQNYMLMIHPSLFLAQSELAPPYTVWQYYERLRRRVKAEIIPLDVAGFQAKLTASPSDAEINDLYEEAKNRFPDPESPEPGFKDRRKIAFQYVRGDFNTFESQEIDAARKSVTDAEIGQHYETNKQRYQVTAEPAKDEAAKPEPAKTEAAKPEPATDEAAKAEAPQEQASQAEPAPGPAAKEEPASQATPSATEQAPSPAAESTEKPAAESPPSPESAAPAAQPENAAAPEPPPAAPAADSAPAGGAEPNPPGNTSTGADNPNAGVMMPGETVFVRLEDGGAAAEAAPATPVPPAASGDAPAGEAQPTAAVESPAPTAGPLAAETAQAEGQAKPAPPTPAEPAASAKPEAASPAAPTYRPLDDALRAEIREELARSRARSAAQNRLEKVLAEVRSQVDTYSRQLVIGKDKPPKPLDVEVLASERGLTSGKTPLVDEIAIQEFELGRSNEFVRVSWQLQRVGFAQVAYADDIPLYQPAEIQGESRDVSFVYWKVEEKPEFVPALAEVREKVVAAWKQREARKLARSEAQELAETARQSGKSLKDAFADRSDLGVKETNEFSWLSTGFMPGSITGPTLSFVDGVESPGEEFMRAVFALHTGEVGTALNRPETAVYVVRIISESPGEEVLRGEFLQSGRATETQGIAAIAGEEAVRSWLRDLESDQQLTWHRRPRG